MHLPDSLELVHWGASAIALATGFVRFAPRPGTDLFGVTYGWQWYRVLYGLAFTIANWRTQQERASDNGRARAS